LENLTAFICKVKEVIQTGKHKRIDIREGRWSRAAIVQREPVALKRVIMWRQKCLQPDYAMS
jgi:hypothetical protein